MKQWQLVLPMLHFESKRTPVESQEFTHNVWRRLASLHDSVAEAAPHSIPLHRRFDRVFSDAAPVACTHAKVFAVRHRLRLICNARQLPKICSRGKRRMRSEFIMLIAGATLTAGGIGLTFADAQKQRLNPVIGLIEQNQPVMGLYAPSNRRPGGPNASKDAPPLPQKAPAELAKETVAYKSADFVFDGSMEYNFEQTLPVFAAYADALKNENHLSKKPYPHIAYPMIVKIPEIAPDPAKAANYISKQLDLGVSGVMFVGVESANEVKQGISAMRYKTNGGTRPDSVGSAPAFWGVSEKDYRREADLWPLNPEGELINWVVVESKEGLKNVREIAAVKGIGVLWPGAGTLRGVFSTTDADGKRVVDEAAWENAIQQVLSACKEFKVTCGIPSAPDQIEMRMKQGFSVFVMNWGDAGFKTIDIGRKAAGRAATNE
jgi:2-keto-3-deoxy-L-rhamnonate aldolase RhmA